MRLDPRRGPIRAAVAATVLLLFACAASAQESFVRLDGIDGGSSGPERAGWGDVLAFSFAGDRSGAGTKAFFAPFSITARLDRAAPAIFLRVAGGRHIEQATIEHTRPGGGPGPSVALRIVLRDVRVTHATVQLSAGEPVVSFSLAFAQIELTYSGGQVPPSSFRWDTVSGEPLPDPTGTATPVPTTPTPATTTPTQAPTASPIEESYCTTGDCDGDGRVSSRELVLGVEVALGRAELDSCTAADGDGDGRVTADELVVAVRGSREGCPEPTAATPTLTALPTDTPIAAPTTPTIDASTATPTALPTGSATVTPSTVASETPAATSTDTPTGTETETPTGTQTETPTATQTETPTSTPVGAPTDTPTSTPPATPGLCAGKPDGTTCDAEMDGVVLTCAAEECGACVPIGTCSLATATACAFSTECPGGETCNLGPDPSPRYVENGDGTVTDRRTCLVWEQKTGTADYELNVDCSKTACPDPHVVNNRYEWCLDVDDDDLCDNPGNPPDGGAFTDFLAKLNSGSFAGHADWRLPTSGGIFSAPSGEPAELESICGPSLCVFGIAGTDGVEPAFRPTAPDFYWSANSFAPNPTFGHLVFFDYFESEPIVNVGSKTRDVHARAVRGAGG